MGTALIIDKTAILRPIQDAKNFVLFLPLLNHIEVIIVSQIVMK
jgi:hypothetical protein